MELIGAFVGGFVLCLVAVVVVRRSERGAVNAAMSFVTSQADEWQRLIRERHVTTPVQEADRRRDEARAIEAAHPTPQYHNHAPVPEGRVFEFDVSGGPQPDTIR